MRIDTPTYFLILARAASLRSTCPRRSVGTVLTRNGHVVSTGYNGAAEETPHCIDIGCLMHEGHCIRTIHSEMNAVARANEPADTAYCTDFPCINCLKGMIARGVRYIYYDRNDYEDAGSDLLIAESVGQICQFFHWPLTNVILEVNE